MLSPASFSVDAVVLLGCRIEASGQPCAAGMRRAQLAADTFLNSEAKWLIASGGRRWHGHAEATALSRVVQRLQVPECQVLTELCSLSTFENARYVTVCFQRLGVTRAAIVTCDWHLPRALRSFRCFGVDVTGVPALSPACGPVRRAARSLREQLSFTLDRSATLGLQVSG